MHLTEKQVQKYKEIYKEVFGRDISKEKALEESTKLLRLVQLIYKPMTQEEFEALELRRKQTPNT